MIWSQNKIFRLVSISVFFLLSQCGGSGSGGSTTPASEGNSLFNETFSIVPGQNSTTLISSTVDASMKFGSTGDENVKTPLYAIAGWVPEGSVLLSHFDSSNPSFRPQTVDDPWRSRVSPTKFVIFVSDRPIYCSSDLSPGDDREDGFYAAYLFDQDKFNSWTPSATPIHSNELRVMMHYNGLSGYYHLYTSIINSVSISAIDATTVSGTFSHSFTQSSSGAEYSMNGDYIIERCN